jgi:catechol 2,3-dioxygenase-like lactoylglutathione lyase family enzyme
MKLVEDMKRQRLSMWIKTLDHVQLAMPPGREHHAREFYQDVLGIPEVPKPPHLAKRGGCWFERGNLKIHLGVESDFRPAKKAHPAFVVEQLRELVSRLSLAGYQIVDDEPLDGYHRVYVDDPFGNRIELMEPKATDQSLLFPPA